MFRELKPGVSIRTHYIVAALIWSGVGVMLLSRGSLFLFDANNTCNPVGFPLTTEIRNHEKNYTRIQGKEILNVTMSNGNIDFTVNLDNHNDFSLQVVDISGRKVWESKVKNSTMADKLQAKAKGRIPQ